MTELTRKVRRVVKGDRTLVVTLIPWDEHGPTTIEVREKGRRTGYRVSIGSLYVMLATRAAELRQWKKAPRRRRRTLLR